MNVFRDVFILSIIQKLFILTKETYSNYKNPISQMSQEKHFCDKKSFCVK